MRYPDGGGLSAEGRARREKLRLQAAQMFEQDVGPVQVARLLRVSTKSAYQWWRRWRAGGPAALASRGADGAVCRLDEQQLARLRAALDAGPAASGWDEDQRWTLARAAALIARLFHVRYTLRGVSYLLHRIGFSPQVPAHRAAERDEAKIAAWRATTWGRVGCTTRSRIPACADAGLFRAASLRTRRAAFTAPGSPAIYAACATGFAWM
jgi:transposase